MTEQGYCLCSNQFKRYNVQLSTLYLHLILTVLPHNLETLKKPCQSFSKCCQGTLKKPWILQIMAKTWNKKQLENSYLYLGKKNLENGYSRKNSDTKYYHVTNVEVCGHYDRYDKPHFFYKFHCCNVGKYKF